MSVVLVVGTVKGGFILRGDDARASWDVAGPIFKGWAVTTSTEAPDGRMLLGTASRVYGASVQASRDLVDWTQLPAAPAYPDGGDRRLTQIWTLVTAGDAIYAGVDEAGLFVSRDGGESWSSIDGLNEHPTRDGWFPGAGGLCAHVVLADPRRPERLFCGISAVGVFRSEDGGASWTPKNAGVRVAIEDEVHPDIGYCVHGLAMDPENGDRIWRQDHTGMYRTTDGAESWERIENGLGSWFGFPIARDRRTGALFAISLESDEYRMPRDGKLRVYRSRDDGDSWQELAEGLPTEHFYGAVLRGAMDVDHRDPCGVYAGTTAGTLHVSVDGGDTWRQLPMHLPRILSVRAYER